MPASRAPVVNESGTDLYILVHPEMFVLNDPGVIHPEAEFAPDALLDGFETHLTSLVRTHAAAATRRVVVDDGTLLEDWEHPDGGLDQEALTGTVLGGQEWELVAAQPHQLSDLTLAIFGLTGGETVTLSGFHRDDCVAKVADILRAGGCTVSVDEPTTLPLPDRFWEQFTDGFTSG
jgi:hypothetical protein